MPSYIVIANPARGVLHMSRIYSAAFLLAVLTAPALSPADDARLILTPKPPAEAKINGPTVYGARPGHPFLYRIPCTGVRPVRFAAQGLPASLHLDPDTGIITGSTPDKPGVYAVTLRAANSKGKASRPFRIVVGETLALTPPMGWNDWYTYLRPRDRQNSAAGGRRHDFLRYGRLRLSVCECGRLLDDETGL